MKDQKKLKGRIELLNLLAFQLAGHLGKPYNRFLWPEGKQMETDISQNKTLVEGKLCDRVSESGEGYHLTRLMTRNIRKLLHQRLF